MTTTKEPQTLLDEHRPTLSNEQRDLIWHTVVTAIAPPVVSPYQRFLRPRVFVSIALIVVVVSTSSTVAASQAARPGDVLFPLEQAVERTQLFVASPTVKAKLRATHLQERWQEVESLLAEETNASTDDIPPQIELAVRTLLDQADDVDEDNRKDVVLQLLEQFDAEDSETIDERINTYRVRYRDNRLEIRSQDGNERIRIEDARIEVRGDGQRLRVDDDGGIKHTVDDSRDTEREDDSNTEIEKEYRGDEQKDDNEERSSEDRRSGGGSDNHEDDGVKNEEGDEDDTKEQEEDSEENDDRSGNNQGDELEVEDDD